MSDIKNILSFTKFLNKFREVERKAYYSSNSRPENDAEHSWQLAMVAWYVITVNKLHLSLEKVLQYCIIHDLVEIYAGDVQALRRTPEAQVLKEQNEALALERIKQEFPEIPEMWKQIDAYESKSDEESQFVSTLDKILPVMNHYTDGGHRWKDNNVVLDEELVRRKKIQTSPQVTEMRSPLYDLLKQNEKDLFITQ